VFAGPVNEPEAAQPDEPERPGKGGRGMLDGKSKTAKQPRAPAQASPAPAPRQRESDASPRDSTGAATQDIEAVRVPLTRDPERTSAAILTAAIEEFSEKGLGGARIDSIAARAGINKRMLYHYFGDKEALYTRALREIYDGIRSAERKLKLETLDPVAGIRELATFTWRYFLAHPEFLSMLATENLNRAAFLRRADWGPTVNSPLVGGLRDLLRRGVEQGLFRDGVDPAELYVTMTGIGYFALSNRHTLAVSFGRDFGDAELAERWGGHMADVMLAWLTAAGGKPPRR
jgi:AcrR family transcriptional regulator